MLVVGEGLVLREPWYSWIQGGDVMFQEACPPPMDAPCRAMTAVAEFRLPGSVIPSCFVSGQLSFICFYLINRLTTFRAVFSLPSVSLVPLCNSHCTQEGDSTGY